MAASDDFLLVAAIDFGTTFSGYAFSVKSTKDDPKLHETIRTNKSWGASLGFQLRNWLCVYYVATNRQRVIDLNYQKMHETIRSNKSWGASLGFQSYKTPTSVLTTRAGEFLAFGYEAEQKYGEALEEDDKAESNILLFRHFKRILHNKENVKLSATISSLDGTIKPALEIFAHALFYMKNHMLDAIKLETGSQPSMPLIRWVITVPAIWSEESKQFMREAAFRAGCIETKDSRRLVIALEPEAASLCCRRLNIAQYADSADVSFPTGTQYLTLDCGGGTIDITAHELELDEKVKELHRASGGPWGGTKVDQNFIELMESILGKNFLNTYRQKHPQEWLQFITNFEKIKKSVKPDGKSNIRLSVQYLMDVLYTEMNNGKKIGNTLKDAASKGVTFRNGMIVIKYEAAKKLFDPAVESVVRHTQELLENRKLRNIKYVFMVGGFSESQVLQQAIKQKIEKNGTKVLIPSEAQLAIIKGAVMFGHRPNEISSRIARYSYGCQWRPDFESDIHDTYRKSRVDGQEVCTHVFRCFVEQNEEIKIGDTKSFSFRTVEKAQSAMSFDLFSIEGPPNKPVQYTNVDGLDSVGCLVVNVGGYGYNRAVDVILKFGGTEIHLEAVDKTSGNTTKTTIDFLSH